MVDIIIPVYNTPTNDLKRCLDSIYKQTSKDYLVYIIDDGSNEQTKNYLDEYVTDKDNFLVKHISNGGVSNARNTGIDISSNEYIAFVDSDDTVPETFVEEALKLIKEYDLELIIGGYNEYVDNKLYRVRKSLPGIHLYEKDRIKLVFEKLLSSKTGDNNKEIGDCPTGRIYTRLFKRDSIGDLRFDKNVHMSEDTLFMIDYMYRVKKIGIVDNIWYDYYINSYSISHGTKKDKLINNIKGFINEIEKRYSNEKDEDIKRAYLARIEKANKYINELKEEV